MILALTIPALVALGLPGTALGFCPCLPTPPSVRPPQETCTNKGTAYIPAGLTNTNKSFGFSTRGSLTGCTGPGGKTGGSISASGSGYGNCSNAKGYGTLTINWTGGGSSSSGFSFSSVGNVVTVIASPPNQSGLFAGEWMRAELAFTAGRPSLGACSSGGITSGDFSGVFRVGYVVNNPYVL